MKSTFKKLAFWPVILIGGSVYMIACGPSETAETPRITTIETIQTENSVENYKEDATKANKMKVEAAFAELDQEIKELEARVASVEGPEKSEAERKLADLKERRSELKADFTQAKFDALIKDVRNAVM